MASMMYRIENPYGFLVFGHGNQLQTPSEILIPGKSGILSTEGSQILFKEKLPTKLVVDGTSSPRSISVVNLPGHNDFRVDGKPILLGGKKDIDWNGLGLYLWIVHNFV